MGKKGKKLEEKIKNKDLSEEDLENLKRKLKKVVVFEFDRLGFSGDIALENLDNIYYEYLYVILEFADDLDRSIVDQYNRILSDLDEDVHARSSLYTVLGSLCVRGEFCNQDLKKVSSEILTNEWSN